MAWRTGRVRWDGREGSQPGVFGGDGGGHQWGDGWTFFKRAHPNKFSIISFSNYSGQTTFLLAYRYYRHVLRR